MSWMAEKKSMPSRFPAYGTDFPFARHILQARRKS